MNIWIFNHYANGPNHIGGTRHYELGVYLTKKGHNVTIIASSFNHFIRKEMINYEKSNYKIQFYNGIKYLWIKTPSYKNIFKRLINILSYTIKAYFISKKILKNEKVDIVIGSSVHPLAAVLALKIAKLNKAKFYFEERDLWPQTFIDFGKISKKNLLSRILYSVEKYLYEHADKVIVLFDKAPEYVKSRGIKEDKILLLPNGVNIDNFKKIKPIQAVDILFEELDGKVKVIYTGSHGLSNYLPPLLDLAKEIQSMGSNNIHFILIGDGPHKKTLVKKAEEMNLKNISFFDPVSKTHIPYLLSKSDFSYISILDSPLYKWGFSMNKIYDYMAAGLPIIMQANPDILGDYNKIYGVIASQDPKDLAEKLLQLSKNEQEVSKMSINLRKFVKSKYSWQVLGEKLNNTFNSL